MKRYRPKRCTVCQAWFAPKSSQSTTCSGVCRREARNRHQRERRQQDGRSDRPSRPSGEKVYRPKRCTVCRVWFTPKSPKSKTCSEVCRKEARRRGYNDYKNHLYRTDPAFRAQSLVRGKRYYWEQRGKDVRRVWHNRNFAKLRALARIAVTLASELGSDIDELLAMELESADSATRDSRDTAGQLREEASP
jgi:hypothetical protein